VHVAIIGNGIAGITAARTIRKLQPDWRISVISSETEHFFSRTALMYIYMGHLTFEDTKPYEDWFWGKNRIDLVHAHVERIDVDQKQLHLDGGDMMAYDKLILAVGSVYNKFDWPGQDLPGVQGLVSYPDLLQLEENSRDVGRAVIVGGGLIGVELAEMLRSRRIEVTFLVREARYMDYLFPAEESALIERQIHAHGVELRLDTALAEILPGPSGRAGSVRTEHDELIACDLVGLTAGVCPNLAVIEKTDIETGFGVLVNRRFETSEPDVYAIGDCAEFRDMIPGRQAVEQLWYTGRMHGETAGRNVAGQSVDYAPGIFFNSAKFFELEYQTYGQVPSQTPDDQETLVWTDHESRLLRINYRSDSSAVVGVNVLGIRFRHEVCESWIANAVHVDQVLGELRRAGFDPEFNPRPGRPVKTSASAWRDP
jgi:NADPH-dependent 2,4-dienoyl-CoA reductase/sulfur reductase-like enzyme